MREIQSDAELQRLHNTGKGLIYNDFSVHGASGNKYNVLHIASCRWIGASNINVRKIYFDTFPEATAWLLANRGSEGVNWKRCGTCHAHGGR